MKTHKVTILLATLISTIFPTTLRSQGWPSEYEGVMLQGFYWNSYTHTRWTRLTQQATSLSESFDLIWLPNSGHSGNHDNMGYFPLYFWNQNSSFGSEEELRTMIETFRQNGIGTIADVVINHHNTEGWFGFPSETYAGQTYQFHTTDICRNDEGGDALTAANSMGIQLSDNDDTGEDQQGCRDLDHNSANVQRIVKAYQQYLLDDLGYAGFRYDMVKGFDARFIKEYNTAAHPQYSIGEYWDGSDKIKKWIDRTAADNIPTSAAFDFQFRYRVRDAFNGNDCRNLAAENSDLPLAYQDDYKRWAVTFVENHDTQYRSEDEPLDPLKRDTLAANAYLLAMPGTPCVFLPHWIDCKPEIRRQIAARRVAGIHSQSSYVNLQSSAAVYANIVQGKRGSLIVVVGTSTYRYTPKAYADTHTLILEGKNYKYYLSNDLLDEWEKSLTRIQTIEQSEREEEESFTPYTATIYCKADFTPVYFYAWDTDGELLGKWPGTSMASHTTIIDGQEWYYAEFPIKSKDYEFNIIFNQGADKPQSPDIKRLTTTHYYTATIQGNEVSYTDVTDNYDTGLNHDLAQPQSQTHSKAIYDLSGRRLVQAPRKGMYITNHQTMIITE